MTQLPHPSYRLRNLLLVGLCGWAVFLNTSAAEQSIGTNGGASKSGIDTFEIGNLRLGLSPAQIQETLRSNGVRAFNEVQEQLSFFDDVGNRQVPMPNWTFISGLWATDGTATYQVFYTPEPHHERVSQIRYLVGLDQRARIAESTFVQSVTAKFGSPSAVSWPHDIDKPQPYTNPGQGLLIWTVGTASGPINTSSPCYQFATKKSNLNQLSKRLNNPVFDALGTGPQPRPVLESCGERYLLIEFNTVLPGSSLMLNSTAANRLVTGYTLILVDVRASVDALVPAIHATDAAKRAATRDAYGKAIQTVPRL